MDDDLGEIPDGVYAVPRPKNQPRVKIRALVNYLKEKSQKEGRELEASDLSREEMEQFLDWTGVIRDGRRTEENYTKESDEG